MANSIKLELAKNKLRLEYFKSRAGNQPSKINEKWVEIYQDRVKKLERQLTKTKTLATHQA